MGINATTTNVATFKVVPMESRKSESLWFRRTASQAEVADPRFRDALERSPEQLAPPRARTKE